MARPCPCSSSCRLAVAAAAVLSGPWRSRLRLLKWGRSAAALAHIAVGKRVEVGPIALAVHADAAVGPELAGVSTRVAQHDRVHHGGWGGVPISRLRTVGSGWSLSQ